MPLTPRKDMSPTAPVQVTGPSRWSYAIETLTGEMNYVTAGHGLWPAAPTLNYLLNSDRVGLAYFQQHMSRLRDAAQQASALR